MGATSTRSERVRAWVLVRAEPAAEVAERLHEQLGHEGRTRFVVVRADVVAEPSEFGYDIIVPVDAESEPALSEAVDLIREESGDPSPMTVRVGQHVPSPPHDAHGYITTNEVEVGRELVEKPGRQGGSPGHNPWG